MGVALDRAGGDDEGGAGDAGGGVADDQVRMDAGHDVGIAGLADADDASVADADVGFDDAQFGVDDGGVLDDDIERLVGIARAGVEAFAVAQGFSGADDKFVAGDGVVVLDLGEQAGVAEPHEVALGGTIKFGVGATADGDHDSMLPGSRVACARASAASRAPGASSGPFDQSCLADHHAQALDGHQADEFRDARLEPHAGAGGHVELAAPGGGTVEIAARGWLRRNARGCAPGCRGRRC